MSDGNDIEVIITKDLHINGLEYNIRKANVHLPLRGFLYCPNSILCIAQGSTKEARIQSWKNGTIQSLTYRRNPAYIYRHSYTSYENTCLVSWNQRVEDTKALSYDCHYRNNTITKKIVRIGGRTVNMEHYDDNGKPPYTLPNSSPVRLLRVAKGDA
jgi:hypothetical protein